MKESALDPVEALGKARVVVFDFDGTLVDSNEIKWRGFESAFSEFPDELEKIVSYCRGFNHTARDDKFRHVCETILRRPYDEQMSARLHGRFERVTTEAIVEASEIPGAGSFLKKLTKACTLAVLSSTPHAVMLDILERRGWSHLFDHCQGAPIDKAGWLGDLRMNERLGPDEIVFFGDTPEDAAAALHAGCRFVGVANENLRPEVAWFIPDYQEWVQ